MGIISLRCRKFCCIGGIGRLLQAVGSWRSLPLPCYSVFYCHYTTCLQAVQPALGPSRAAGKNFNLRGTGRNVRGGHSCFLCKSGGRQILCGSQKRRHKNSSLCQFDCAIIEKLRDHNQAAALLRAAISLKERQCNSCF